MVNILYKGEVIAVINEERKIKIAQLINEEGIVQVQQLADIFNVSIYTVRRDLSDLEKRGLIKKTHGGAVKVEKSAWLPTIEEGRQEAAAEKKAIAMKALEYIEEGDTIFLMGSTITGMVIPHLDFKRLTVVTNSLDVAVALCQYDTIETIVTGGRVKNYKGNILGSKAVEEVRGYYFDKSFIPCGGVQQRNGVTTSTIDSADLTRAVVSSTGENILIADYRKIGRVTFSKVCDISAIHRLITDDKADKNELEEISKENVLIDIVSAQE